MHRKGKPLSDDPQDDGGWILVVDDDPDSRESLRDLLEVWGYRVKTAADGSEALAAIAESAPALVLMDVRMPVMDGRETLARIRADARHGSLPVAIVTAEELKLEGAETLRKPVDTVRLHELVRRVVGPRPPGPHPRPPRGFGP